MAKTAVPNGVVFPQSRGTGLPSESDQADAALFALLMRHTGNSYVATEYAGGLQFVNHDASNNTVDIDTGVAYIRDDSTSTSNERSSGGNPQSESTDVSGYDVEVPDGHVYLVLVPNRVTIDLGDTQLNDVFLNISDVTSNNEVEIVHDDGGGLKAPSDTSIKLGEVNPDDASQDRRANDGDKLNNVDLLQINSDGDDVDLGGNALTDVDSFSNSTDIIGTAELDQSISPTWTGSHTFKSNLNMDENDLRNVKDIRLTDGSGSIVTGFINNNTKLDFFAKSGSMDGYKFEDGDVEIPDGSLSINTGGYIQDESGTARINIWSNNTRINYPDGRDGVDLNSGGVLSLRAKSTEPVVIYDDEGDFEPLRYKTSSSPPGELKLSSAEFIVDDNLTRLKNTSNSALEARRTDQPNSSGRVQRWICASGAGLDVKADDLSDSNPDWEFQSFTNEPIGFNPGGTRSITFYHYGLVTINRGNLRVTGQSIEGENANNRFNVYTNRTSVNDENGRSAFYASGNESKTWIQVRGNRPLTVRDNSGAFSAINYTPSSTKPGELELTNSYLRIEIANGVTDNNGIDEAGVQVNSDGITGSGRSMKMSFDSGADGSAIYDQNGELIGLDDAGNTTTLT